MLEHQKDKNYQHLVAKLLDSTAATVMTGLLRMVQAVLMGLKYKQYKGECHLVSKFVQKETMMRTDIGNSAVNRVL